MVSGYFFESIAELAFVLLNGEKLRPEQRKLLDQVLSDPKRKAILRDSIGILKDLRECLPFAGDDDQPDGTCIDEETLGAFLDGSLDAAERGQVLIQISKSRGARQALVELGQTLRDAGLWGTEGTSTFDYVIGLAKDALQFLFHPNEGFELLQAQAVQVLGPIESKTNKVCEWRQTIGELTVSFRVLHGSQHHFHLHVSPILHYHTVSCHQLTLFQEEQISQSATVYDGEGFSFRSIKTGIYRVEVAPMMHGAISFIIEIQPLD